MDLKLSEIPSREYFPGYHGKMIHMENMTLAYWDVNKGAEVPEHAHHHEQMMQVLEGRFEFTLNGERKEYGVGEIVVIPPNQKHSARAITDCRIMDIFSPVREDYK